MPVALDADPPDLLLERLHRLLGRGLAEEDVFERDGQARLKGLVVDGERLELSWL